MTALHNGILPPVDLISSMSNANLTQAMSGYNNLYLMPNVGSLKTGSTCSGADVSRYVGAICKVVNNALKLRDTKMRYRDYTGNWPVDILDR